MRVALTIWGERISPVLDSSSEILIARLAKGREVGLRRVLSLAGGSWRNNGPFLLASHQVDIFICGALCLEQLAQLRSQRIQVFPFLTGQVEEILQALVSGADLARFLMPGCHRLGRCCAGNKNAGLPVQFQLRPDGRHGGG